MKSSSINIALGLDVANPDMHISGFYKFETTTPKMRQSLIKRVFGMKKL